MTTYWALRLVHFLYATFTTVAAWLHWRKRRQPNPLKSYRSKIPKHLCLNLVADNDTPAEETEAAFVQCVQSVASWCRVSGIESLTVYDRHGVLYRCSENVHQRVFPNETSEESCESEVEYPLTPPPSESSGSRSHSPEHAGPSADLKVITMMHQSRLRKRRNHVRRQPKSNGVPPGSSNLTLHIASRASGKPAIVSASRSLLQTRVDDAVPGRITYKLTVAKLAMVLEVGLPPPDFMIIHHVGNMLVPHPPVELHGFPPWQTTLTEFHRTHPDDGQGIGTSSVCGPELISETAFCRALDEYSRAEFRLGK